MRRGAVSPAAQRRPRDEARCRHAAPKFAPEDLNGEDGRDVEEEEGDEEDVEDTRHRLQQQLHRVAKPLEL